ncbi:MAG: hypothetical protein J6X05_06060 [Bacteroidales bacterium]|nr:hypothetical protein [Bacteroidales bacterium]
MAEKGNIVEDESILKTIVREHWKKCIGLVVCVVATYFIKNTFMEQGHEAMAFLPYLSMVISPVMLVIIFMKYRKAARESSANNDGSLTDNAYFGYMDAKRSQISLFENIVCANCMAYLFCPPVEMREWILYIEVFLCILVILMKPTLKQLRRDFCSKITTDGTHFI